MRLLHTVNVHRGVLGGVQSVLDLHALHDGEGGLDSRCAALFDRTPKGDPFFRPLAGHGWESISSLRRRLEAEIASFSPQIVVWHHLCGAGLTTLPPEGRGIGFIHSADPGLAERLAHQAASFDGLLYVTDDAAALARAVPHLEPWRLRAIRYPVNAPADLPARPPSDAFRVGYLGRLVVGQKRVDRIPEWLGMLPARRKFSVSLTGVGDDEAWLRAACRADARVSFDGLLRGGEYWRRVAALDAAIFFSDYEGTPLALVEAMKAGVVPIYPRIGSGGDALVSAIDEGLLYPPGDMAAAVVATERAAALLREDEEGVRARVRAAVTAYSVDAYRREFAGFVAEIAAAPKVSTWRPPGPPILDRLPLGAISRLFPGRFDRWL